MVERRPIARSGETFRACLELVRLPNVLTAIADVTMGFLFVQAIAGASDAWTLGLLVAASSLLYAAGVVLNDLFDLDVDARERPERPLPSGRVSRRMAAGLGWGLLLLGVALGWVVALRAGHVRPGVVAGLLAGCIVLYDAYVKRTPAGPLLMGGCRMLNVLLGMSILAGPLEPVHWLVSGSIGTYVVGVTWFARTEARRSNRWHLALATVVMMLGVGLLVWCPHWMDHLDLAPTFLFDRWYLMMAVLAALIGWHCLSAVMQPDPVRVQAAVQQGILAIIILDAAVCLSVRGLTCALMILLLLPLAMLLGRSIRLT